MAIPQGAILVACTHLMLTSELEITGVEWSHSIVEQPDRAENRASGWQN
jgi:hypothetical protein